MTNIKDIAIKAGVSVATVSHVINGTRFVSEELENRIRKIMEELDYRPNLLAGSLRKKKSGTVGVVIPDSSNIIFAKISKNLENIFFSHGYSIMVCNTAYDINREIEHLKTLRARMADGIFLIPATTEGDHIRKIKNARVPIIVLDRKIEYSDIHHIILDNFDAGYQVGKYLVSLGHRNMGYIDRSSDLSHSIERRKGFIKALKDNGASLSDKNIIKGGFTFRDGVRAAEELLKANPEITAIFSFNDINALGAIRGLINIGLKVPEDVSVIGFDNLSLSSIFIPSLTTIDYPAKEIAIEASKLMLKEIKELSDKDSSVKKVLKTNLIIRDSTAKLVKDRT